MKKPRLFDRNQLKLKSLRERRHDLSLSALLERDACTSAPAEWENDLSSVAERIIKAREKGAAVILLMGAHVIRSGVQRFLIDLIENRYLTCIAMNGAGMIHDFEFSLIGATTESVARYIREGQFGLWKETGIINDIIHDAYTVDENIGMGTAVAKAIASGDYPHKDISVMAAAWRAGIPVTVHVGLGYDIIHELPNCDGAATGALSYNDFLLFAAEVQNLEGGVVMNFGSAVMSPEIFLKALSMARNVAHQQKQKIAHFTTLVCDLHELPRDFRTEPEKGTAAYFFRPWKTMLVRTVADGGESFYIRGTHRGTIPALYAAIERQRDKTHGQDN